MLIEPVESFHLGVPFKSETLLDAGAWGDKNRATVETLMVEVTTAGDLVGLE